MSTLDSRIAKKQPASPGLVAKKVRKLGEPSNTTPPDDAPKWAVNSDVIQSEYSAQITL